MDAGRFATIVKAHQGSTYAAAYRVLGNREDALEVAQDALLAFYERSSAVDAERVAGWLARVATNRAIDRARRRARVRLVPDPYDAGTVTAERGPDASVMAQEERRRLHESLARLPVRQREVVSLRILQQMTFTELSRALEISEGAAKVHFRRGILALRRKLSLTSGGPPHVDA